MADTPIQPASGSVTATGVVAAMAMSLTFVPQVGGVSLAGSAPGFTSGTATVITPTVGSVTLAGVAPTFVKPTSLVMTPTVGALTLAGVASGVSLQAASTPSVKNLLTSAGVSGGPVEWFGGAGLLAVVGTFGGGTVQLQMLGPDNVTWLNIGSGITQAGTASFTLPDCLIQATVSGATNASITAVAYVLPTQIAGVAS